MIRPLAIPLHARLDHALRLIDADPPLLRLHLAAGGTEGGELAIPQLFDVCRMTQKLGAGLSRPILIADGNSDVSLWVETCLSDEENGVIISVLGWRDRIADNRQQDLMRADLLEPVNVAADGDEANNSRSDTPEETTSPFNNRLASALSVPLGRIVANAETIGARLQGPLRENYASYARDIADAARHLQELVNDLADLDVVERRDFSVEPDIIELNDVVRRAAGLLSVKAADHHMTIQAGISDGNVKVVGEFRRVLQILVNLIANAIRYSPDGTTVRIEVADTAGMGIVSVVDEGAGIPEEKREAIFEKFERLGRSGDGGSGLGLYISRYLANAMHGDLTVGASDTGGAVFTLALPLATEA